MQGRSVRSLAVALSTVLLAAPSVSFAAESRTASPTSYRSGTFQDPPRSKPFELPTELRQSFDSIFDLVPPSSCLTVSVGGVELYRRNGDEPVTPASTQKLLTAVIALDRIGAGTTFDTRVVSATAPSNGVIPGDLYLVGGGDPLLATDRVIEARGTAALSPTRLDVLADRVAEAGITSIEGRVLGDESRYDVERHVATWPSRFLDQEQSGPLGALSVDDGYDWTFDGDHGTRRRSSQPAESAATTFAALLLERGITVGGAGTGTAPAGTEIATISSAPLSAMVDEMLITSDNQTAELLLKEIGHRSGGIGSTEAGLEDLRARALELGLLSPGAVIKDGSGLDPENRTTCDQLVRLLEQAGGPESAIGRGLPVAAESGTLRNRFHDTPVAGRLRAKTGRLNGVSSLAGYVPLASGETAAFGFVVNDTEDEAVAQAAQTLMAVVVAGTELPCHGDPGPMLIGTEPLISSVGTASAFPLPVVLAPGLSTTAHVMLERTEALVDACLASAEGFAVVAVPTGPAGSDSE